ncbi:hypothetical protein GQ600_26821 [Phytophthora cactorum]|nr:hypothetical protein GQ600_26821 [Phytophthora cactorum]
MCVCALFHLLVATLGVVVPPKNSFYDHCHPVLEEVYHKYPRVRQVAGDSTIIKDVELMVASGNKASRVYDYIRENSPHYVQLTDIYNMVGMIKKFGAY